MEARQCKKCGKLFNYIRSPICVECTDDDDKEFHLVKDYIYEHPKSNLSEISESTGVDNKVLLGFLREGRIALKTCSQYYTCARCGDQINTGVYCIKCKNELTKTFSNSLNQLKETEKRIDLQKRFGKGNLHTNLNSKG